MQNKALAKASHNHSPAMEQLAMSQIALTPHIASSKSSQAIFRCMAIRRPGAVRHFCPRQLTFASCHDEERHFSNLLSSNLGSHAHQPSPPVAVPKPGKRQAQWEERHETHKTIPITKGLHLKAHQASCHS